MKFVIFYIKVLSNLGDPTLTNLPINPVLLMLVNIFLYILPFSMCMNIQKLK